MPVIGRESGKNFERADKSVNGMQSYPCKVVGLNFEGRDRYIVENMRQGDALELSLEPQNPYDPKAVAVYHNSTKIGYIPADKRWVLRSICEGDEHIVVADDLAYNDLGEPTALSISIFIVKDGNGDSTAPIMEAPAIAKLPPKKAKLPEKKNGSNRSFFIFLVLIGLGLSIFSASRDRNPTFSTKTSGGQSISPPKDTKASLDLKDSPMAHATKVIRANFEKAVCASVRRASWLEDGSIDAECNNGERFRVFKIGDKDVAMRCKAVAKMGVSGC
jgi:HIRAN domain